jgi:hypothetical protein
MEVIPDDAKNIFSGVAGVMMIAHPDTHAAAQTRNTVSSCYCCVRSIPDRLFAREEDLFALRPVSSSSGSCTI